MRNLALPILFMSLLTGCAVGPDYARPPIVAPAQLRGQSDGLQEASSNTSLQEAASLADHAWWEIFRDEVLVDLIEEALRNGHEVRRAAWRVEEARAAAGIARSEFMPGVQAEGGWSRGRPDSSSAVQGTAGLYEVRLGASWEIDLWGRIRRLNEASLARYLSTEEARRGVLLSLVSEVATGYFELRALDWQLEIARRTTGSFQETHTLFDQRLEAGIASALETSSAQGSVATSGSTIPDLERRIAAVENRLAFLIGRNPGNVPRGAALTDQLLPPDIPAGIPSDLLKRRPDLRQAEQELVAANAGVGVAVANYFPSIRLTGLFGGVAPQVSELFPEGKTWSAGGGLLTPVFQGRRLGNQRRAAVARWEQARVDFEQSVNRAFAEVSTALVAYQKLADVEREQARAVDAYRDAVNMSDTRYASGLSDYLEVLQARQQLFPVENSLARTRLERLTILVELYRALGGGWQQPDGGWARTQPPHKARSLNQRADEAWPRS